VKTLTRAHTSIHLCRGGYFYIDVQCIFIIAAGHTVAIKTCRLRAEEVYRIVFIIHFLTTLLLVKSSCCETTTGERDEPSHNTNTRSHKDISWCIFIFSVQLTRRMYACNLRWWKTAVVWKQRNLARKLSMEFARVLQLVETITTPTSVY
jgi:hypothetical protein